MCISYSSSPQVFIKSITTGANSQSVFFSRGKIAIRRQGYIHTVAARSNYGHLFRRFLDLPRINACYFGLSINAVGPDPIDYTVRDFNNTRESRKPDVSQIPKARERETLRQMVDIDPRREGVAQTWLEVNTGKGVLQGVTCLDVH